MYSATTPAVAHRGSANVAELLRGPLSERPRAPALVERVGAGDRVTTFAELDDLARRVATLLAERGVGRDDAVLFFAPPSRELYATLIAVFRLGAVAMFVEPSAGVRILDAACAMLPPRAFVGTPRAHVLRLVAPALRRVPLRISVGRWVPGAVRLARATSRRPHQEMASVNAADAALVTFTSGSTGQPKGAVRSHGVLRAQLDALRAFAATPADLELVSLPIVVLINLATGAGTVLPDADLRRPGAIDARTVLRQIDRTGVSRMTVSPSVLERLSGAGAGTLERMRTIVTGGGPVFPDIVAGARRAAPRSEVVSVYGSTEAEPIAHLAHHEVSAADEAAMRRGAGLLAGRPAPVVKLRVIVNAWGTPLGTMTVAELDARTVPAGAAGEIVVSGAHVVPGYLNGVGDEETKFRVEGAVWHRTGDLGRLDEQGRLWLLGRASAIIEDGRGTLFPFAVECAARARLGGRPVAAVSHDGRRLLVLEAGPSPTAGELTALKEALTWAQLDDVITVPRMPLDRRHNSKIDYPALVRLLAGRG